MKYSTSQKVLLFIFPCIITGLIAGSIMGLILSGLTLFLCIYLFVIIISTGYGSYKWLFVSGYRESNGEKKSDIVFNTVFAIALCYIGISTFCVLLSLLKYL